MQRDRVVAIATSRFARYPGEFRDGGGEGAPALPAQGWPLQGVRIERVVEDLDAPVGGKHVDPVIV